MLAQIPDPTAITTSTMQPDAEPTSVATKLGQQQWKGCKCTFDS